MGCSTDRSNPAEEFGDVHLRLPKHEAETDATVHYRDEPELLDRLCGKIALEALALSFGAEFALQPNFDSLREYVLRGGTVPFQIETVRLPSLNQPDSVLQHTVDRQFQWHRACSHSFLWQLL